MLSHVRLSATPWTVTQQPPLSMEFSRKECWSGLPFSTPGDLPDPGIKPTSLASPCISLRQSGRQILYHCTASEAIYICCFFFGCAGSSLLCVGFL